MNIQAALNLSTQLLENMRTLTESLSAFREQLIEHSQALAPGETEAMEQATLTLMEMTASVDRLSRMPMRQMRLLARMLQLNADASLRDICTLLNGIPQATTIASDLLKQHFHLKQEVRTIQHYMESLQFALRCVQEVNEELIHLFHGTSRPNSQAYTPEGTTSGVATSILDKTI